MLSNSYDTVRTQSPVPFVYYHCDCLDLKSTIRDYDRTSTNDIDVDDTSNLTLSSPPFELLSPSNLEQPESTAKYDLGHQLLSPDAARCLYPLSRLYFCEDCHEIRCPHCVQDEIISYYCPNCLFEVPTASVKGEKNRCARNCFQCPICQNTLGVNATKDITTPNQAGPYFLACNVCRWNSQEIDMLFEKPTGLALQLLKNEDDLPSIKEFEQLKVHFEKHLRINLPPLPSSFLSFSSGKPSGINRLGGLNSTGITCDGKHIRERIDDITDYTHHAKIPSIESVLLESLMGLQHIDSISTATQRRTQLYNQPHFINQIYPQRTHLCIKRSKRCRTCRHILIKPEPKAQTTRFKIKLVAMNYIPTITITRVKSSFNLVLGESIVFALKFTNPMYEELTVKLATHHDHVTLLAPHFSISAYNDTIDYDDDVPFFFASDNGIHEKHTNHTSVLVKVVPHKLGEFKFPLWVTCQYKSEEDRLDMSLGDPDDSSMVSLVRLDDVKMKTLSFGCLIGLGNVTPL